MKAVRLAGRRVEPLAVRATRDPVSQASHRLVNEPMKRLDLNLLRCNQNMGRQLLYFVRARCLAGRRPATRELLKKLNQNFTTV